jgi:hypothetical protein
MVMTANKKAKFKCVKSVPNYFTKGKTYSGYINDYDEPYATDDSGKNFNLGYKLSDPWYKEHFKRA